MLRLHRDTTRDLVDLGGPTSHCEHCGAIFWYGERLKRGGRGTVAKFSLCCGHSKVKLPYLRDSPHLLDQLMDYNGDHRAKNFRANIRPANCLFNFTSFGANIDKSVTNRPGPFCYRIYGETYHCIGSLLPSEGEAPKFAQLYVVDTENEVKNRMAAVNTIESSKPLDEQVVADLKNMFDVESKLVDVFRRARDAFHADPDFKFKIKLVAPFKKDGSQYATGECPEVVGLIVGEQDQLAVGFEIIVQYKGGKLKHIDMLHPSYMPLQYPILFPYGEDGYHLHMKLNPEWLANQPATTRKKRNRISPAEYYRFRLQQRLFETTRLLKGGKLLHQFIVDAYTCVEQNRLSFHEFNQHLLRSELYQGLADAFSRGDTDLEKLGKRIVLPSSFTGGPRYMQQNYQDAMAICRVFGNPDLFITFTCNAKWKEFKAVGDLIPGQKIEDRPEVVARVFKMKLDLLLDYLKKDRYFGKVEAVVYTIEFQKRGLPHAHIVLWLDQQSKPLTAEDIDLLISAKIPDPDVDIVGHLACQKFMMHGPCGRDNPRCPCMLNGECSKKFPKDFNAATYIDDQGFPVYKRPEDGVKVKRGSIMLDNRYVIPHNLDLIIKFDAHINVEWCNKSHAIKYLFKYISKGADRVRAEIRRKTNSDEHDNQINEIADYLDCRYLSAIEGCWRLFEYNINHREPAVQRLQFHLPDQENVVFKENQSISYVVSNAKKNKSMLVAWFEANTLYPSARELTYADFPRGFVWDIRNREWRPRKQGRSIGRMYYAHPASGDRFYLRILLNVMKGCTSYEDLRTCKGQLYGSFREACRARGLIGEDDEWREALNEAYRWANGFQMRDLFATIIMHCEVADPKELWEQTWNLLGDDILHSRRQYLRDPAAVIPDDELQDLILVALDLFFRRHGTSLGKKGLPKPKGRGGYCDRNHVVNDEMGYDRDDQARQHASMFTSLNPEQLHAYNNILESVNQKQGKLFFVYGQGGTGKTHLWKTLLSKLRSEGRVALAVASSGIAALLLPGGRTAHSRFKIPFECQGNSTCSITPRSKLAELIRQAALIIWDEAPMDHRHCFEAVDRTFRDIMSDGNPAAKDMVFGGKTVVLGGDFRQVLPVVEHGDRIETVRSSIIRSKLWKSCNLLQLTTNMRLNNVGLSSAEKDELAQFAQWLLDVGNGDVPGVASVANTDGLHIRIPEGVLLPPEKGLFYRLLEHP